MLPVRIIKKLQSEEDALKGRRVRFPANIKDGAYYRSAVLTGIITGFGTSQVHVKGDDGLSYAVASDRVELL